MENVEHVWREDRGGHPMVFVVYATIQDCYADEGVEQGKTKGGCHDQRLIPPIVDPLSFPETLHQW